MLIQVDITRFASPHCISVVCFLFVFRLFFSSFFSVCLLCFLF